MDLIVIGCIWETGRLEGHVLIKAMYNESFPYLDILKMQNFSEILSFKSRAWPVVYMITPQLLNVYCLQKKMDENNILPEMRKKLYLRT